MYKTIATMKKPRPTQDAIETVVSQFDDTTGFLGLSQKSEAAEKSGPLGGPMSSGAVVKDASSSSSVFPKETDDSKSKEPMSPKIEFPKGTKKNKGSTDGKLKLKKSTSEK